MRKLMYEVKKADGTVFTTSSYSEATAEGNKIKRDFLVPMDTTSEKQKEWMRKHAQKFWEKRVYRAYR